MEKLLIIEDHPMMRLFLSNYFSKTYDITAVASPEEALGLMNNNDHFSLILADFQTPGSQNAATLQSLKQSAAFQGTPLVVLTDEHKSLQRIQALDLGADDSLSKPFNPVELNMRINHLIKLNQSPAVYRPVA